MAVISILSNGSTQGHKPLKNVLDYCMQEAKTMKDGQKLVSGIDCLPETAYSDMMATKKRFGKTDGREYYHILQSFAPDEVITPEEAHRIACEYAQEQFKGYELRNLRKKFQVEGCICQINLPIQVKRDEHPKAMAFPD